jgi:hypothetical protein
VESCGRLRLPKGRAKAYGRKTNSTIDDTMPLSHTTISQQTLLTMFQEQQNTSSSIPGCPLQQVAASKRPHSAVNEDFVNSEVHQRNKRQYDPAAMGRHCAQLIASWTLSPDSYLQILYSDPAARGYFKKICDRCHCPGSGICPRSLPRADYARSFCSLPRSSRIDFVIPSKGWANAVSRFERRHCPCGWNGLDFRSGLDSQNKSIPIVSSHLTDARCKEVGDHHNYLTDCFFSSRLGFKRGVGSQMGCGPVGFQRAYRKGGVG